MRLPVVVRDDVIHDFLETGRGLHDLGRVDSFDLDVFHLVFAFHGSDVLDRELQDVLIADGIGNDVAMQLVSEEILCCSLALHNPPIGHRVGMGSGVF